MDLSEYEEIKKNTKLLEDSLARERGLQDEVKKLNEEKIEALEAAKMKVVKVKKTYRRELALVKREPREIIRGVLRYVGLDSRHLPSHVRIPTEPTMGTLIDQFFDLQESNGYSEPDEITMHGLEEVKSEIRKELKGQLDSEVEKDLKSYQELLVTHKKLKDDHKKALSENKILEKDNKKLDKLQGEYEETYNKLREKFDNTVEQGKDNEKRLEEIRGFASDASAKMFGKTKLIQDIYGVLNRKVNASN